MEMPTKSKWSLAWFTLWLVVIAVCWVVIGLGVGFLKGMTPKGKGKDVGGY